MTRKEIKDKHKLWLTPAILESINVKTQWLKKSIKTKNRIYYLQYKYYRDKLNSLIRTSKKIHYKSYFTEHLNNSKQTWNGINEILGRKRNLQTNISINKNKTVITNEKEVADTFNKYFVDVAENLSRNLGTPKNKLITT